MKDEILGMIEVWRPYWGWNPFEWSSLIHEQLIFTSDRMLVIRKWSESRGGSAGITDPVAALIGGISDAIDTRESKRKWSEREKQAKTLEDLLRTSKHNFAVPNPEIRQLELKRGFRFHITTKRKKLKWYALVEREKKISYPGDYEKILRPIFGDKLYVKK